MKNLILFSSLFFLCATTYSQSREEKIALRKQRVKEAVNQNTASKLSSKQVEEIDVMSSTIFTLMNYIERSESLEETEAFYTSVDTNIFEQFTTLIERYKKEGIQSNILNNQEYLITTQIPDFFNNKAYTILNERYQFTKQQFPNVNGSMASEKTKEAALQYWELLEVHTRFFQNYKHINPKLASLHNKVSAEVAKITTELDSKYQQYVKTPLHKKYREKVVLAYQPIEYGAEVEGNFLDEVIINDTNTGLHFMYYNNVPNGEYLKNSVGKKQKYVYAQLQFENNMGYAISNGCLVFYDKAYDLTDDEEKNAYLSLPLVPTQSSYKRDKWLDPTYYRIIQCLLEKEVNVSHRAKILFGFPGTSKIFEKTFSITITDKGHQSLQKTLEKIDYEKLKEVRMGRPGAMHTNSNIALVKQQAAQKGFKVKKVVITGDQFKVYKDSNYPYDIKNKACSAEIAYEENGKCYVYEFQIVREYQGGGTYGSPVAMFSWGGKFQILCENISN